MSSKLCFPDNKQISQNPNLVSLTGQGTYNIDPSVKIVRFELYGGGGSGSTVAYYNDFMVVGGGGMPGGFLSILLTKNQTSFSYNVGIGGRPGSPNGEDTSVTYNNKTYTSYGGSPGTDPIFPLLPPEIVDCSSCNSEGQPSQWFANSEPAKQIFASQPFTDNAGGFISSREFGTGGTTTNSMQRSTSTNGSDGVLLVYLYN